jgi:uncharacterized protein involved in oxidation of intracellular sulfur
VKTLLILNDPPYGTERFLQRVRLLNELMKKDAEGSEDARGLLQYRAYVEACACRQGTSPALQHLMDARGLTDAEIMPGAKRSSMDTLAAGVVDADKVLVF